MDLERPALFWWLGVTPYLTGPAVEATLRRLGSLASSAVVLDHASPMDDAAESAALMRRRREAVARLGEPWVSTYAYPELAELVLRSGFTEVRPEDEGAMIRRCLGLPPAAEPRPSHLAWPPAGGPVTWVSRGRSGWSARAAG